MSKNIVEVDTEYQEEEIDIYKLLDIFLKNLKIFVVIFVVGMILTVVFVGKKVFFDKNNIISIQYTVDYTNLESYLNGRVFYIKKSPANMLLDDKYLDKIFENEDLKNLYEKKVKENKERISTKRRFLFGDLIEGTNAIFSNSQIGDSNSYNVVIKIKRRDDKDREISYSILNTYIEVLKEFYNEELFNKIEDRKKLSDERIPVLKEELRKNSIAGYNFSFDKNSFAESNFLKYTYPNNTSNIDVYYSEYVKLENEKQGIDVYLNQKENIVSNFIRQDTSVIEEREKTGAVTTLGIGIILSIVLGVVGAFSKEFIEGYKKSKE